MRTLLTGPEIAREAQPGQFVNVQVLRTNDPLLRRPFSVHAAYPEEGTYSLLYVLVGRGTALLSRIPAGEMISVVGPLGRPFDLGDSPDDDHIVVAGGCGAAPLHLLCDALCRKWTCDKVTVLAGAQGKDSVICETEFRAHGVEVGISTDDGSYGFAGTVVDLLEHHLRARDRSRPARAYSCGPHAMLREVARVCRESGIASCQVSLENNMACGLGVCMGCVQKIRDPGRPKAPNEGWHYERVCTEGPVFNAEDVIWE